MAKRKQILCSSVGCFNDAMAEIIVFDKNEDYETLYCEFHFIEIINRFHEINEMTEIRKILFKTN